MKLKKKKKNGRCVLGVLTSRGIADMSELSGEGFPRTMGEALSMGREAAVAALEEPLSRAERFLPGEEAEYAPAVDDPEKILCVGKNYAAHAAEIPELFKASGAAPEIFAKFRNTLAPHNGQVRLNPRSKKHDYEAEIAVIIGRRACGVTAEEAMDYVFGYTLANDISARDLQKAASQWTPGKTCDTFCPLGPWIVTADELAHDAIRLTGYKNGQLRQSGCSGDMIFSIPYIVSFLSGCCTLEPGDVILTGTPAGVIFGRPEGEQDWLKAGDTLEVRADGIGALFVTVTE